MKRITLFFLLSVSLLVTGVLPAAAQGIVMPQPGVFTDPNWLRINYHRVNVTIENQIATTEVDMQFTNEGEALAEGTFIFPLPEGASVDQLIMHVDGLAIEAKILPAEEARTIYNEIVRQYRDPALLEYINSGAIQANIFPIPPGDNRRIEISYQQVLEVDNGLIQYVYPLHSSANSTRTVDTMSISVDVVSNDPISNIYSPSHPIAVSRTDDGLTFRTGFEESNFRAGDDFSLFYGIANDQISMNLLSYRESADADGFFMMLVQPPLAVPDERVLPKDVFIVLDQSGSMQGIKWDQAREAAAYVLDNLNARDRFNVIAFSTGVRVYSNNLEAVDQSNDAINWINSMNANGGTDINMGLLTALDQSEDTRNTTIIFMTDGVATEGETESDKILENITDAAPANTRIFTFGVGDDVDTFLLDQIVMEFKGASSYVRPSERIDEEVASLYNKISLPVLTDLELDFGDVRAELLYPQTLPDLFAGEQLTLVGRFRDSDADATVTLSGSIDGEKISYVYDGLEFRERAGGEPFIARLWATRRIGDLLNTIRLNGENDELVDSIVDLSVRYGIITPYTSFLIEEDDILSQQGRDRAADEFAREEAQELRENVVGQTAVTNADAISGLNNAQAAAPPAALPTQTAVGGGGGFGGETTESESVADADDGTTLNMPAEPDPSTEWRGYNEISNINDKTFVNIAGVWNDTSYDPDTMETNQVEFLSDAYFDLLDEHPELADYFALGDHVIVVIDGVAYEVTPAA